MTASRTRFARVPVGAAGDRALNVSSLRVLIAISAYADAEGFAYPSHATISQKTGIEICNLPRAIAGAEKAGYLVRCGWHQNRTGKSRRYRIVYAAATSSQQTTPDEGETSSAQTTPTKAGHSSAQTTSKRPSPSSQQTKSGETISSAQTTDVVCTDYFQEQRVVCTDEQTSHEDITSQETAHTGTRSNTPGSLFADEQATAPADGKRAAGTKPAAAQHLREFEDSFWPLVPKRTEKAAALKQFITARKKKKVPLETLVAAMARYARQFEPAGPTSLQYAKNPAGWLAQERWADELPPPSNGSAGDRSTHAQERRPGSDKVSWIALRADPEPDQEFTIDGVAE